MSVPARLLGRLDDLGQVLERRGDAIALIGVGSVGHDVGRLDEHSDMDFFVVVQDAAKPQYLASVDWLEEVGAVAFSFANTPDGRKALFADGLFAEYAVFTLAQVRAAAYTAGRVVWRRADAPDGLEEPADGPRTVTVGAGSPEEAAAAATWHVNEALTNLYVGMHRELRGERLSGARFIQGYAVDQVLAVLDATEPGRAPRQDVFALERGVEGRYDADALPLPSMVPGYEHNADAARAILDWLESRAPALTVDAAMAAAIRALTS